MTIEQELRLSYYREVANIDAERRVSLVQDIRSNCFYVKKCLTVYNADIYRYLQAQPIDNTPRIYLVEEDCGVLTVIEEYIHGTTLDKFLDQNVTLPESRVLDIAIQVCRILRAFHRRSPSIIHRDIKPSNIILLPNDKVYLLDFNAAKWSNTQAVRDTTLLGTQGYAAPEQYGFGPSNVQADIYAVGVLINVMLTNKLPGEQTVSGRLGKIIENCVDLNPSYRFKSIDALLEALSSYTWRLDKRRFLPPGFRHKNKLLWLPASLLYLLLLEVCLTLELESARPAMLAVYRLSFTIAALAIVLFSGNYLDIHKYIFPSHSKNSFLRFGCVVIVDAGILFFWLVFFAFVS